jgi:hypothetical protein
MVAAARLNDHVNPNSYLSDRYDTWACGFLLIHTNLAYEWESFLNQPRYHDTFLL